MADFIRVPIAYNALTTQGEGSKLFKVSEIVHVSGHGKNQGEEPNQVQNGRKVHFSARILLKNGESWDVKETIDELQAMIIDEAKVGIKKK